MKFNRREQGGDSASNGKDFIRLKDGQSVSGVIRGDAEEFYQHWVGGKTTRCLGLDTCELCKKGDKGSFRFRVNMIVKENGAPVAKILEQGYKLYSQLADLSDGGWDLDKTTIRISRQGSDKSNTVYSASPLPNGVLTDSALMAITQVPLHEFGKPKQTNIPVEDLNETEDDLPF